MEKADFRKYFTMPFEADDCGSYIWDSKGHMVANGSIKYNDKIVDILNGKIKSTTKHKVCYKEGCIINADNEKTILVIRGWGYLTGIGACRLKPEDAAAIQDDLANFIVKKLNDNEVD